LDDVTSSDVYSYNDSEVVCNDGDLSILDQILIMVFGTLPIISGTTIGEHYSFLKGGHDSVINDWRTDFGRHLTLVDDIEAKPQKDHHSDYIFEASAWDDDEDWDDDKDIEKMKRAQGMIFQRMFLQVWRVSSITQAWPYNRFEGIRVG
jgi:hypothetical protein